MDLFIILGAVVLITFVVLGVLFFLLSKEGQKKDFSSRFFEQKDLKVSLPTQEVQTSLIETLTKENESLKSQQANLEQAQHKLIELQGEASGLKTENTGLKTQLESTHAKARLLEEEMAAVKIQMGEEISRVNATVSELNYKLIKARAQSSGLERVSFNYKNQLEDFLRKSK